MPCCLSPCTVLTVMESVFLLSLLHSNTKYWHFLSVNQVYLCCPVSYVNIFCSNVCMLIFSSHYSIFNSHYSIFNSHYSIFYCHYSIFNSHYSIFYYHYSIFNNHCNVYVLQMGITTFCVFEFGRQLLLLECVFTVTLLDRIVVGLYCDFAG